MKWLLSLVLSLGVLCYPLLGTAGRLEREEVVATLADQAITNKDVLEYARRHPRMTAYLQMPGGPKRLLNNMIVERLLILEGKRRDIPWPAEEANAESIYLQRVYKSLVPDCSFPTEAEARAFYDAHPEEFSTPLFLRLQRIGLRVTADNEAEIRQKLEQLRERIEKGQISFAAAAAEVSEDPIAKEKQGDLGFVPDTDPDEPILAILRTAELEEIKGPIRQGSMFFLYRVTDRREPILEPYASARERVAQLQLQACRREALDSVIAELKQRWPVEILVENSGIWRAVR